MTTCSVDGPVLADAGGGLGDQYFCVGIEIEVEDGGRARTLPNLFLKCPGGAAGLS